MARYINPTEQYLDSAGNPLTGGKLYFYESGTLTLLTTYSDESETTANTNPVILDSSGRHGSVFFSTVAKVILKDQNDVQIWERDPVGSTDSDQDFASWSALFTYSQYDKVLGSDNLFYISLQASNFGNNPTTPSPTWWNEIKFLGTYNANETYGDNAFVMDSAGLLWRSQQAANTGHTPTTANNTWWVGSHADDSGGSSVTGNITTTAGNVIIGTSGKGIDFSASAPDGTGSVDTEVLADYEEGTFSPTLSTSTLKAAADTLAYTRIGRVVYIQGRLDFDSVGSGDLTVSGLPFTIGTVSTMGDRSFYPNLIAGFGNLSTSFTGDVGIYAESGTSFRIRDQENMTGTGSTIGDHIDATTTVQISGYYFTD